jgi:hypothetical protein
VINSLLPGATIMFLQLFPFSISVIHSKNYC